MAPPGHVYATSLTGNQAFQRPLSAKTHLSTCTRRLKKTVIVSKAPSDKTLPEHTYIKSLIRKLPFQKPPQIFTREGGGDGTACPLMVTPEHMYTAPTRKGEAPLMAPRAISADGASPSPLKKGHASDKTLEEHKIIPTRKGEAPWMAPRVISGVIPFPVEHSNGPLKRSFVGWALCVILLVRNS